MKLDRITQAPAPSFADFIAKAQAGLAPVVVDRAVLREIDRNYAAKCEHRNEVWNLGRRFEEDYDV